VLDALGTAVACRVAELLRTARSLDLHGPADYSLVALDDPEWADLVTPSLSVVHQPTELLAQSAMDALIARMHRPASTPKRVMIPPAITFRDSVR
jgi:LacI family transcriptional regulator